MYRLQHLNGGQVRIWKVTRIWSYYSTFYWRSWGKSRKTSLIRAYNLADIKTRYPQNIGVPFKIQSNDNRTLQKKHYIRSKSSLSQPLPSDTRVKVTLDARLLLTLVQKLVTVQCLSHKTTVLTFINHALCHVLSDQGYSPIKKCKQEMRQELLYHYCT